MTIDTTPAKKPLELGMRVRDRASGLTGIATCKTEMLHASAQFAIQPEGDGKTFPEGLFVDVSRIEYVDDGIIDAVTPPDKTVSVKLGEEVEDLATGFRGHVIELATHINGCVTCVVTGKADKDGKRGDLISMSHKRLKKIGNGLNTPEVEKFQAQPAEQRGGCASRKLSEVSTHG